MTTATDREVRVRRSADGDGRAAAQPVEAPQVSAHGISVVTAEELNAKLSGPIDKVAPNVQAAADDYIASYKEELLAEAEHAMTEMDKADQERRRAEGLGAPRVGSYVSYDIVSFSPLQFIGPPPYLPHKIVASGEPMLLRALQWINPRVSIPEGFAIPATKQLGGRHLRVRFDLLNITTGVPGPGVTADIPVLPAAAPTFILFSFFMIAPPVGDPQLFEVNVTSDIVGMSQPYAAFATWHRDNDVELPWLAPAPPNFPPTVLASWRHGSPMRFMVYAE